MSAIISIILTYFIGAFPTAYLAGKLFKKIDIRKEGSGNVGTINIYRAAGLLPGIITVLLDVAKGYLAIWVAYSVSGELTFVLLSGLFAVIGHNYSLFLKFKGGKGLATSLGIFLALSPQSIPYIIILAVLLTLVLRDTNTAFGSAAIGIPLVFIYQHQQPEWPLFGLALAVVILIKHIPDYRAYFGGRRKIK